MHYIDAFNLTLQNITPIHQTTLVDINNALDRVLATNIYAKRALPPYNNSAMDGYAFKYKDINSPLKIAATIFAQDKQEPILKDKECYKIMTGAKVPPDCDSVAPKEICEVKDNKIKILKPIKKGNAIRLKGEEVLKDSLLLEKGERLTASKIALLASQGINKVECYRDLKIAILSTGSELKEINEEASEDEIYNINGINIKSHLKEYGIEASYLGLIPDSLEESSNFFKDIKDRYNIIFTTGGVSQGDADFTKRALLNCGFREIFHGLKVKPGHPLLVGKLDETLVISLPGNPLAAIIHAILFGVASILKMQGAKEIFFTTKEAKISTTLTLKPNRVNIVLGEFRDSYFTPYKNNKYGSGMILPLVKSNSIALFSEDIKSVEKGSTIKIIELRCKSTTDKFNYIM